MVSDPRPLLDRLGVQWDQVVPPDDGYTGTWEPQVVYAHWTASARGSDVAAAVVAANDYHACVSRSGVCALGGWNRKQAHGGSGRSEPIGLARAGAMTLEQLRWWQTSVGADDTDSEPNRYGWAASLDNDGLGEPVPAAQWDAFAKVLAVGLSIIGRPAVGYLLDHAASTNRKVDLATSPAIDVGRLFADVARWLAELDHGPTRPGRRLRVFQLWREVPDGHLYVSDGIHVRWMQYPWDFENVSAQMRAAGFDATVHDTTQHNVESGQHGVLAGEMPPW